MNLRKTITVIFWCFLTLIFLSCEKNLDWSPTFNKDSAQPYGAKSLFILMPEVLGSDFEVLDKSTPLQAKMPIYFQDTIGNIPFDDLIYVEEKIEPFNLFIVRKNLELSPSDVNTLDLAIRQGAHVLLASENFSEYLKESYDFELEYENSSPVPDTGLYNFPRIEVYSGGKTYKVRAGALEYNITGYALQDEVVLEGKDKKVFAFKRIIGNGSLTICSAPKLLSNIHLLYQSPELVQSFYQNLPSQPNLWGNDYYSLDFKFKSSKQSLLNFIFKYQSLKWAWYLTLMGAALFILSNMKRIQRAIKQIKTNENMSLQYVKTVAMLYQKTKNHAEIFRKKVEIFNGALLEKYDIRRNFTPQEKANRLYSKTSRKTEIAMLERDFNEIDRYYQASNLSKEEYLNGFETIENLRKKYL